MTRAQFQYYCQKVLAANSGDSQVQPIDNDEDCTGVVSYRTNKECQLWWYSDSDTMACLQDRKTDRGVQIRPKKYQRGYPQALLLFEDLSGLEVLSELDWETLLVE